jgi:hypothetical protein
MGNYLRTKLIMQNIIRKVKIVDPQKARLLAEEIIFNDAGKTIVYKETGTAIESLMKIALLKE